MIGIIGGAGVAATNKLLELIETKLTKSGAFRDCHHPEMLIWQATQVPSRSMFLEGKGESFIPGYVEIAKKLKMCGASKIAMCCNTAHYAIDEISKQANISFINLVEACVVKAKDFSKVGLVASDGCLNGKVYEYYFEKCHPSCNIIYPDPEYQKLVTKAICNVKNTSRFEALEHEDNPAFIFKQVKRHLKEKGAQKVIFGCTDIGVVYHNNDDIDSLNLLAEILIKEVKDKNE